MGGHPGEDREGWGAVGQAQLFDVLAAQIEAAAGAMAAKERSERGQFFKRRINAARTGRAAMHATLHRGAAAPLTALHDEGGAL
eukprot:13397827-Alexandrium_andersonii.AAC.1